MHATYTKLKNGEWGIRIVGADALSGPTTVSVLKKDGSVKREMIGRILWRGNDVMLCTIDSGSYRRYTSGGRCRASGCSGTAVREGFCRECAFHEFDN